MSIILIFCLTLLANPLSILYSETLFEIPSEHENMLQQHSFRILGVGAACIDLLVPVEEQFLAHVPGEKGGSQAIEFEKLNHIIALSGSSPQIATGGSCANTIKGLANLGERCGFLSHMGSDSLGEHFSHQIKKLGIVGLFSTSSLPTARVLCLITPDGQRTMRFFAGSSEEMSDRYIHPNYFKGIRHVHLEAYFLRNGPLLQRIMELAKKAGATISLDVSSFEIIRQYHQTLHALLSTYVDVVFANENEVKELTGLSAFEGCGKLQEICPIAVVLMGERGCLVGHQGRIVHSPAFPAKVIDSTGAGDLFASGFLYGYIREYPLEACARLGNRLGSAIVEVKGADLPEGKWQELRALIAYEAPVNNDR